MLQSIFVFPISVAKLLEAAKHCRVVHVILVLWHTIHTTAHSAIGKYHIASNTYKFDGRAKLLVVVRDAYSIVLWKSLFKTIFLSQLLLDFIIQMRWCFIGSYFLDSEKITLSIILHTHRSISNWFSAPYLLAYFFSVGEQNWQLYGWHYFS